MSGFKRFWKYNKTEENWNQFTHARNRYFHAIQKVKHTSWTTFLQGAAGKDIFTAYHYIKPWKIEKIPPIKHEDKVGVTFKDKCDIFLKAMFSKPPQTSPVELESDNNSTKPWVSVISERSTTSSAKISVIWWLIRCLLFMRLCYMSIRKYTLFCVGKAAQMLWYVWLIPRFRHFDAIGAAGLT